MLSIKRSRSSPRGIGVACGCVLTLLLGACGKSEPIHLVASSRPTQSTSAPVRTERSTDPAPSASASRPAGLPSAARRAKVKSASPPLARAVGQMLMSHVTGTTASSTLLARIRSGRVGSVILYSENIESDGQVRRLTASLQEAARAGGNPPLFIGTDQEGGSVKRLRSAPPTMSARQMGEASDPFSLAVSQGRATGAALRAVGINLDFAPVADVPTTADNFLQDRAFGRSQRSVLEGASGFAQGLAEAHVAGSAKHFPGLGDAGPRDSDFTLVSIPASKSQLQGSYAPYVAMAELGQDVAPMVMISDASYPSLDPSGLPAVLSSRIIHTQLAVAGMAERLTITDDLEVPSVRQYSDAAVKAAFAGDDILMFAQRESGSELAYAAIVAAARRGEMPASLIEQAAARVVELKRRLGLR